ncbi:hypothetical protein T05_2905 [Trichinella murrelli]|uniref:Uncharacterized protein n=1 Tax=Trichinella murrelli TaxID=144512 RepID=A0A0V0T169_9BILA|nr:hypothetical protein T05_2905 [Trichinella murrelli]
MILRSSWYQRQALIATANVCSSFLFCLHLHVQQITVFVLLYGYVGSLVGMMNCYLVESSTLLKIYETHPIHVAIEQQRPLRFCCSGLLTRLLLVSVFAVTDTRPRDFLAYALFTFVKASATSNVNCIRSFWFPLMASLPSVHYCHVECPKNYPVPFSTSMVYQIQCSQHPRQIYAAHVLVVLIYNAGLDTSTRVFSFLLHSFTLHTGCVQT